MARFYAPLLLAAVAALAMQQASAYTVEFPTSYAVPVGSDAYQCPLPSGIALSTSAASIQQQAARWCRLAEQGPNSANTLGTRAWGTNAGGPGVAEPKSKGGVCSNETNSLNADGPGGPAYLVSSPVCSASDCPAGGCTAAGVPVINKASAYMPTKCSVRCSARHECSLFILLSTIACICIHHKFKPHSPLLHCIDVYSRV